jgi:hypothetical protein
MSLRGRREHGTNSRQEKTKGERKWKGQSEKGKFDMVKRKSILASDDRVKLVHAVGKIQRQINWKVGKDVAHLNKRRQMQHLQPSATM